MIKLYAIVLSLFISLSVASIAHSEDLQVPLTITDEHGVEETIMFTITSAYENEETLRKGIEATYKEKLPELDITAVIKKRIGPEAKVTERESLIISISWEYEVRNGEEILPCRDMVGELMETDPCVITLTYEFAKEYYKPFLWPEKQNLTRESIRT